MADAIVLIFLIVLMYLLIDYIEDYFVLIFIGFLFMFLGFDVINQLIAGSYDRLFGASIPAGSMAVHQNGIGFLFAMIPVCAFMKIVFRRMQNKRDEQKKQMFPIEDDSE